MIYLDGSYGEGGGQILRTALTLSMMTQTPFTINNIRANRKKAGLMRQHLTCVKAAQQISHAKCEGAELHSQTLSFYPQVVQAGDYHFDIGSAGSTTLVLQTVLPALIQTNHHSTLVIKGGTHNPMCPTTDFIQYAYLPALHTMGIGAEMTVPKIGFAPVGGGQIQVQLSPLAPSIRFNRCQRGKLITIQINVSSVGLERSISERVLQGVQDKLADSVDYQSHIQQHKSNGQGIVAYAIIEYENHCEVLTVLGEKSLRAELVGKRLAGQILRYLKQSACVEEYLTDQLLLPLVLRGGGRFTARSISQHTQTQIHTIKQFLPMREIHIKPQAENGYLVEVV